VRSRSPHNEQLRNLCSIENETEIKDASKTLVIVSLTVGLYLFMINGIVSTKGKGRHKAEGAS
jgi:hypothetical protein